MAKLRPREAAQRTALQGNVEAARAELSSLERNGDVAANASLAEIAAYQRRWKELLQRAEVLFGTPSAMYTHNVYQELTLLVARAGAELGDWQEVQRLADFALSWLTDPEKQEGRIYRVRLLKDFALRKGRGPYGEEEAPEEQRRKDFEALLEAFSKNTEKRFKKPDQRRNRLFALARTSRYYPGAVALYDQEKALPFIFDNIVFAASALARAGRGDEAWNAIRSSMHLWWPVEVTQVAPVVLLTDDALKLVMTPARCEELLRTPRGPSAKPN
jgi:hypothetical protein